MYEESSSCANQVVESSCDKSLASDHATHSKAMATGRFSRLDDLLNYYEEKMVDYIYEVPHIPPTTFELKIRHTIVKKEVVELYQQDTERYSFGATLSSQQIADQIDQLFNSIVERNSQEHKICQTGFVIGWKSQHENETKSRRNIQDRF